MSDLTWGTCFLNGRQDTEIIPETIHLDVPGSLLRDISRETSAVK
jgi:hypothetical protein